MHPPQPGDVLLDRYTLIRRLGSGLGGETWAAHGPDRAVAVKMIRNQNERAITDLLREASLLRRLRHPHVVIYREFADRPDEGVTYLVTDLARGGDLETYIHTHGPRSPGQIAQLGQQLISALRVLHQHGVLHRDLKPANILVEPSKTTAQPPTLKVADFGISRQAREGKVQTRDLSLTPLYAAPEQHAGVALSFSADIYALGGVLGYLATAEGPKVEHLFGDEYIELVELIGQMRAYAPDKRPDLDAIEKSLVSIADNTEPEPWPQPSSLDLTPAIPLASPSKPAPMPHQAPTLMPASTMMPEDVFSKTPPPFKTHPTPPHRTRRWIPLLSGFSAVAVASVLGMSWYITTAPAPETSTEPSPETLPETLPETSTEPSPEPIPEPKPIDSVPLALPGPDPTPPPSPKPVVKPAPTSRPNPETASTRTATVQIISKPQSEIFIDGVSKGRTRVNGTRVTVSAGSHTIRLETEDGRRWQGRYKLDTDAPHRLCYFFDSQIEKCWK